MSTALFSDQNMMNDMLSTQKFITSGYNTNANEASNPKVKHTLMSILDEEHTMQHDVFAEMQNRGWYQTEAAPQDKVAKAKQSYSCSSCSSC